MKVSAIFNQQNISKLSFRSDEQEWNVVGIDEGGKSARDYIRNWHEAYYIPYQSIYERDAHQSEYEFGQMIKNLTKKNNIVNNELLNKMDLYNLERLGNTNSYRGAMIKGYESDKVIKLKQAGIKRIASFMKDESLKEVCSDNNIEYLYFNIDLNSPCMKTKEEVKSNSINYWTNIAKVSDADSLEYYVTKDVNEWNEKSRKSVEQFIDFIKFMQKDNVYAGCACGTYRTDFCMMLNVLFNPSVNYFVNIYNSSDNLNAFKNLYSNLTKSDKLKLGWTKSFDESFFARLNKFKM